MLLPTLSKLLSLARSGATVIVYKNLPADVPGYGQLDENRKAFTQLIASLQFKDLSNMKVCKVGSGRLIVGADLSDLLRSAKIRREPIVDNGVQFNRRKSADGSTTYFIANQSGKQVEGWFPLQSDYKSAMIYNPLTAGAGLANTRKEADAYLVVKDPLHISVPG